MAETTGISWTRSTFNPFIGCTKVGPGCDGCYAEALDKRMRFGGATHWGAGVPRYRTSASNWAKPLAWNKAAPDSEFAGRKGFWPVFCASLGDVFDNEVPDRWRMDLFSLIADTPNLSWLLVTKRIGNVLPMCKRDGLMFDLLPHVRIIITVVNQEEADRDIPKLLALPCKNGISYEPALSAVDWRPWLTPNSQVHTHADLRTIQWVICGGESSQPGHPARPFNVQWARDTIAQCKAAEVPCFFKQAGSHVCWNGMQDAETCWPNYEVPPHEDTGRGYFRAYLKDRAGADPAEWPSNLRVREFPHE